MRTKRNELQALVETVLLDPNYLTQGITSKELTLKLKRTHSHICQVLRTLTENSKIHYSFGKKSLDRSARVYFSSVEAAANHSADKNSLTCGSCQWLSAIQRCTLLDLAVKHNPSILPPKLKIRVLAQEISRDAPSCQYFNRRVPGQLMSRPIPRFLSENKKGELFHCPIERCKQVISEFSFSLQVIKLGSNAFYCPSCGAPMIFGYDEHFDDYRVYYWDSHFDILQESFHELTGEVLPERNKPKRSFGVSIIKDGSFTLNTKSEVLFVGGQTTLDELVHSPDLTFFPLRKLKYIYTKHWEDYYHLEQTLHKIDPATNRRLYENITLYPPIDRIESVEPLEKEVGGNELLITSGILDVPTFHANLTTRETFIETKISEFVDSDLKVLFSDALTRMKKTIRKYKHLKYLDFKQWQRYEGGVSSLMVEPLKREAQKYGFITPARPKSRMVRYDHCLPFGLFYARSAYDSLLNGVYQIITSILKKEVYNSVPLAWNGLRGWCHRGYPIGLYLDSIEQAKIIALLWIHEAIRNKEILPSEFKVNRGKRYEPYFCVEPNSELHIRIRKISMQVLNTAVRLPTEQMLKLKQVYVRYVLHQKELLNRLANHSVELQSNYQTKERQVLTLWKKLQQTKTKEVLTLKERQQVKTFSQKFFADVFTFEPLTIVELNY